MARDNEDAFARLQSLTSRVGTIKSALEDIVNGRAFEAAESQGPAAAATAPLTESSLYVPAVAAPPQPPPPPPDTAAPAGTRYRIHRTGSVDVFPATAAAEAAAANTEAADLDVVNTLQQVGRGRTSPTPKTWTAVSELKQMPITIEDIKARLNRSRVRAPVH